MIAGFLRETSSIRPPNPTWRIHSQQGGSSFGRPVPKPSNPERHVPVMLDPKHPLAELLRRDDRYEFDAYVFVFDALRFGQEKLGLGKAVDEDNVEETEDEEERHVSGPELCHAIQRYAIEQYGLLARNVLNHWGVRSTGDFGEIVFNLIDIGQMRKTENDRREDFDEVFDFDEAFCEREVFSADCAEGD